MYIITEQLADDVRGDEEVAERSALNHDSFAEAFFAPRTSAHSIRKGDVGFFIVDMWPERKRSFSGSHQVRRTSAIVVRAHAVQTENGGAVQREWSLQRWDLRGWCTNASKLSAVLNSLRKVKVSDRTAMPQPRLQRHSFNGQLCIADAGRPFVHRPPVLDADDEQRDALAIERWPEGELAIDEWQARDD